jgi:hypothetical protein
MRIAFLMIAALAFAPGCQDGLVVVEVDAATTFVGIARLHVLGTVGSTTREHDVASVPDGRLPGDPPFTFGMYVSCGLGDSATLKVEARGPADEILGSGRTTAPVRCGARTDGRLTLVPGDVDGTCLFDASVFDRCSFGP